MLRSSIVRSLPRPTSIHPTPPSLLLAARYRSSIASAHIVKPTTRLQSLAIENIRRNALTDTGRWPQKRGAQTAAGARAEEQRVTTAAKEEAKAVLNSYAELIAGRGARENVHHHASVQEDWFSITKGMVEEVPRPVMVFGLAGTIPYIGTSAATIFLAREVGIVSTGETGITGLDAQTALAALHTMEHVQITYGAIILSFLGALHWGMEFARYGGEVGYERLIVGTVPVLLAWPTTFLTHGVALAVQWASFTGVWMLDQRASTKGWTPSWYSTYRFYLSIVVGFSIIFTLAGTSYYGAGSGSARSVLPGKAEAKATKTSSSMSRLGKVAVMNDPAFGGKRQGSTKGDVVMEDLDEEGGDAYVKIHHVNKSEETAKAQQQDKDETESKQDTKEINQAANSPQGMKTETKG